MAYCQKCGKPVRANDKFCNNCGAKLPGFGGEHKEQIGVHSDKLVTKSCAYCDGTGEVDVGELTPVYRTCPVCKGDCSIRVPENYVSCPICTGTGKEDVGDFISVITRCKKCKGTGWASPPRAYR
jgi:hypothetical protein